MPTVGLADVLVRPVFTGAQKSIAKEFDGIAKNEGDRTGRTMGGFLGKALKGAALTGVAGGAALLGTALTRGFGRLTAIENAKGKLVGLGHSAKSVETIMTNATAAVKGTAFGLDEAATVAANAVAAGVKPGQDLERTLKLVADASTIAGTDMASMGAIFNKAAASNKVQMDVINQLHDAGVPALALIAEQLGVTAAEASKMASDGKVDFATFQAAMEKGLGGAALESGKTLQGALKNSMAAIGRFGANLMSGVYPQVREFFNGFIGFMAPLEDKAKVVGEALGIFVEKTVKGLKGLYDLLVNRDYTGALSEAFGIEEDSAVVEYLLRIRDAVQGIWDLLVKGDYTGALSRAFGLEEDSALIGFMLDLRDAVMDLGEYLRQNTVPALEEVGQWVVRNKDWLQSLIAAVAGATTAYLVYTGAMKANAAMQSFIAGESVIMRMIRMAQWFIGIARAQGIATAAQWAFNKALGANPIGRIIMLITGLVAGLVWFFTQTETGKAIWENVWSFIKDTTAAVVGWFSDHVLPVFVAAWDGIKGAAESVARWYQQNVAPIFEAAWSGIQGAAQAVVAWFQDHLVPALTGFWSGIQDTAGSATRGIQDVVGAVVGWFQNTAAPALAAAWGVIRDSAQAVVRWFQDHVAPVFQAVFGAIGDAFQVAVRLIQAGYNATLKPVFDAIGAVASWLWQHVLGPLFHNIGQFALLAFDIVVYGWKNILRPALEAFGSFLWDLWSNGVEQVFGFIGSAWGGLVNGVRDLWNGVLRPVFELVGAVAWAMWTSYIQVALDNFRNAWGGLVNGVRDLWNGVLRPVFELVGAIAWFMWTAYVLPAFENFKNAWGGLVNGVRDLWNGVLRPAFEAVGAALQWLWDHVARPVFGWVAAEWEKTVLGFKRIWETILLPAIQAVGAWLEKMWTDYAKPVFRWIGDAWGGMINGIRDAWNDVLKPVFKAVVDWVTGNLVAGFERAVKFISDLWSGLKRAFATPINWVLTHVWNNGIVKTFNAVAQAVDSKAELKPANLIALGSSTDSRGNTAGQGGHLTVGRRARGGQVRAGQPYIVGEEGPELIFPDRDGYVATARQSEKLTRDLTPEEGRAAAGRTPAEALLPMGEFSKWDALKLGVSNAGAGPIRGLGMMLGNLMQGAEDTLIPLVAKARAALASPFGSVLVGAVKKMVGSVLNFAKAGDSKAASGNAGQALMFEGPLGKTWYPGGRITSHFGPRWGTVHSGTDFAGVGMVRALWNGIVRAVGWNVAPGRTGIGAIMDHARGLSTYYGHMARANVRPGQVIPAGGVLGVEGTTGNSTGVHLHQEIWERGRPVNPLKYLVRDKGGNLPPGLNMVLNGTGKSEAVLTDQQWRDIHSLAARGSSMPERMYLVLDDGTTMGAYVTDKVDARLTQQVRDARQFNRQMVG